MSDDMEIEFEVCNIRTLNKKYKGKHMDADKVAEKYGAHINLDRNEFEYSFTYLQEWDGEEYTYELQAEIDSDLTIKRIYAPTCQRLLFDDIRGSGYKNVRMDEYDYSRVDRELHRLVVENS